MHWKLVVVGGFASAALGTVAGVLVAVAAIGPDAVLDGSVAGGLLGSAIGWTAVTRRGWPAVAARGSDRNAGPAGPRSCTPDHNVS